MSTAIGDFAEGVPVEEWPYWKEYAVEPPSAETSKMIIAEPAIPDCVNAVVEALRGMNSGFGDLAEELRVDRPDHPWRGSSGQPGSAPILKWVYPATADDDEFLKRATLASTLFLDGLLVAPLRKLLGVVGNNLHLSVDGQTMGSRRLLQRIDLMAVLIERLRPKQDEIPDLLRHAESRSRGWRMPSYNRRALAADEDTWRTFSPLAFLL